MQNGIVKIWNESRGYGFISPEGGVFDIFVQSSGIQADGHRTLDVGDRVRFRLISDERGKRAEDVIRIP